MKQFLIHLHKMLPKINFLNPNKIYALKDSL